MSTEENKKLVRDWIEAVDTGNPGVVDDYLSAQFTDYNPPPLPSAGPDIGSARAAFKDALGIFTDFRHEVLDQWAEGDTVVSRITGRGRHTGEFLGILPTGNEVQMEGIVVHQIKDGKIVEHRAQVDALGLMMQLGAFPPPGSPPPGTSAP